MNSIKIRSKLEQLKGQYNQIKSGIESDTKELSKQDRRLKRHEQAREIIREVGLKTQEQLQFHISDITSMALEAVFGNKAYKLEVEFIQRRNKTECDIFFSRKGKRINPTDASGGGALDVASFALRIASWSLQRPHNRNTIILDEPMSFLSKKHHEDASLMLQEVSRKLGIQFILVTHNETLANYADKIFKVSINKGISNVETK